MLLESTQASLRRLASRFRRVWFLEVDDLVQEACVAILLWKRANPGEPLSDNLVSCVAWRSFQVYAKKWSRNNDRESLEGAGVAHLAGNDPDADVTMDVRAAIDALPPNRKAVVVERFYECRSFDELAERWGISRKGVERRQLFAWADLRGGLDAGYGPDVARKAKLRKPGESGRFRRRVDWSGWGRLSGQRTD
jgi:RNA polymerase sigma factor (sigma-70 family)